MRNSSIDFFRAIAIFAIIILHTSPFLGSNNIFFKSLYIGLSQASRFAVPYFFIVAGYFFGRKIQSGAVPKKAFMVYVKRLLPLYIIWSFFYIVLPTNIKSEVMSLGLMEATYQKVCTITADPVELFFQGGRGHLWFLLSLLIALGIISLFLKLNRKQWIIPISSFLYFSAKTQAQHNTQSRQ